MPTTVTSSIGTTGRDYSTMQAWEDAAPANLVTSDQIWLGECYNDSTFTASLTISGSTSDATRYKKLTAAAGQSFADTPSNALRYDASNGATLAFSSGYATALKMNESHAKLSRMQIRSNGLTERSLELNQTGTIAEHCIIAGNPGSSSYSQNVVRVGDYTTLRNCLVEKQNTNSSGYGIYMLRSTVVNCTVVNTSGSAVATGISVAYSGSSCVARNNGVFGFATSTDSVGGTNQTNYTDNTSPGSGWTGGIAFTTSTFANVTSGSWDFKLVSGSALLDVGTTDTTHGTPDIFGTARPSGSSFDVGAFEYAAGGGGTPVGLSTETDTSIALSALQIAATGQASETDAALALAGVAVSATGRADETDTALPLAAVQIAAIGLATETDTALALDAGAASAVGRADEADAAFALAAVQIGTVGLAAETDAALALTGIAGTAPGIASETDAAFALAAVQIATTGLAEESDEALAPGSVDAGVVVSLSGRPKSRAKRLRYQDYDVPLSPEVLTSTIPQDTPPTGIEPAPSLSKLGPASKLATRPAKAKAPKVEGPAPPPVITPEPQAVQAVAPAPVVTAAAPVPAVATPARPLMLSDILAAESMTNDEILRAMKVLARLHIGPQLKRGPAKLIRG